MGLSANFPMREVTSSTNSYANCHEYLSRHIQLRHTNSIVTGFYGFILFLVSLIPVYHHRIWYFPVMGVKRGGCMFQKNGEISRGDEKRKGGGTDEPFCTMHWRQNGINL